MEWKSKNLGTTFKILGIISAIVGIVSFGLQLFDRWESNVQNNELSSQINDGTESKKTNASEKLDTSLVRTNWERAIKMLLPLVLKSQSANGGISYMLANPEEDSDPWISAQFLTAVFSLGKNSVEKQHAKRALQWIESQEQPDGWSRYIHTKEPPSTEVTAWVGIAYESAFSNELFDNNESSLQKVISTYSLILKRQNGNGAWPSFPIEHPERGEPTLTRGGYATTIALTFLIRIYKNQYYNEYIDHDELTLGIERGLRWILSEYNSEVKGWEERRDEGLSIGLSLLYLNVLTEAKRSGFSQIEPDLRYRRARSAWLRNRAQYSDKKELSETYQLTQKQHVHNEQGEGINTFTLPVRIIWYPWSLLLVTYLSSDKDLLDEDRNLANRVKNQLLRRITQGADSVIAGETFRAVETLLVFGYLGREFGWET